MMSECEECGRYHPPGACNAEVWEEARRRTDEEMVIIWRRRNRKAMIRPWVFVPVARDQ